MPGETASSASSSSAAATTTPTTAALVPSSTGTAPLPLAVTTTAPSEEMRSLFEGQKRIHEQILKLQSQIEEDEAAYLDDTSHGNIIRGWDGFIDSKQSRKDAALKKVKPYTESEHLFSSCCVYATLANEPTMDLADYHRREDTASSSARRRMAAVTASSSLTPSSSSSTSNSMSRASFSGSASATPSALAKLVLERRASFSGAGSTTTTTPTLGRPPKIKKRKRLDRLEIASTASATQSETGEDDDKEPPPLSSSTSLKKSRSTTGSDAAVSGDFVDML